MVLSSVQTVVPENVDALTAVAYHIAGSWTIDGVESRGSRRCADAESDDVRGPFARRPIPHGTAPTAGVVPYVRGGRTKGKAISVYECS